MEEKLTAALSGLLERLEAAETFVLAQAPVVCQEIVKKKMIEIAGEFAAQIFGMILAISLLVGSYSLMVHGNYEGNASTVCGVIGLVIGGLFAIIMMFCMIETVTGLIVVKSCPKLFLLKELKKLLPSKE